MNVYCSNRIGKTRGWIFLGIAIIFSLAVQARHYVRVSAGFSYTRDYARAKAGAPFDKNISLDEVRQWVGGGQAASLRSSNGYAPAIGFGYRYRYRLLLVDVGFGAEYRRRFNQPYAIEDVQAKQVDNVNMEYTGHYTWNNRETRFEHVGIILPVMIGVEWHRIYAMAGIKAGLDVWGRSMEKGAYTLKAEYPRYMSMFENIPGHGLVTDEPYETPFVGLSSAWSLRACAEIGYCFWRSGDGNYMPRVPARYYVGAFAEYGFAGARDTYVPLLAGIRLTVLLPLPEPHICNCLKD